MLIDTHCHLTSAELVSQTAAVVQRAQDAGVQRMITIATSPADARMAMGLLARHPRIFMAAGVHPHEAGTCTDEDLEMLTSFQKGEGLPPVVRKRIVAVGETGLDFHYDFAPPERQEKVFRFQLALASKIKKPVVIHARQSESRVCDILKDYPKLAGRVVFHCYSGDAATATRILDMGFWLSFTGIVTFKNADATRDVVKQTPLDRLLVETDSPYLSPVPVRSVRPNEPAFVAHTARFLADLRGEPFERFAQATTANAVKFFGLPEETL